MDEAAMRELAKRFFDAIEARDLDAVAACYADDVKVWHNFDGVEQTKDENLASLKAGFARIRDRIYVERRVDVFSGGFVQQHMIVATRLDGEVVRTPVALVCLVSDGKITRIDEYFESGGLARMRGE